MAQVSLQINGYGYILGCGDGEEPHLRALAADLNRRIDEIKVATGPSGEARMLLMAALMLSDELHDIKARGTVAHPVKPEEPKEPKATKRLRGIAKRAEALAAGADAAEGPLLTAQAPTAETPVEPSLLMGIGESPAITAAHEEHVAAPVQEA